MYLFKMEKLKLCNKKIYNKKCLKLINSTSNSIKSISYGHKIGILNIKKDIFYIKLYFMILLFKKCAILSKGSGRILLYKLLNN